MGNDAREIGARVFNRRATHLVPAQPGVLQDVFGIGGTAQHAIGESAQRGAMQFEVDTVWVVHRHPAARGSAYVMHAPRRAPAQ